ncbi:MAG: response regulator [Gammaproteobacteria bacterium]|nr:response regulator [Gammaproteobacteria bacterium]MDH3446802.1 response regulator [Gammaproteobacteria bacterium]
MKALLIEDPARPETSLGVGLRDQGYAVDAVADGLQAIVCASQQCYDIIILDLMLPRESSLRVLHEIRESDREVEILILSTPDQIHDRVTALIQGADDYLVKPFSFDELHARIQQLLRRKAKWQPPAVADLEAENPRRYQDSLIGNLLDLCGTECDEIELVISEVRLANMLQRVCASLQRVTANKQVSLRQPAGRLPTLLVDARWMEHLLSSLLFDAIAHSPTNAEISIRVSRDRDRCRIDIESEADRAFDLTLAKTYGDYLNLGVGSRFGENRRHRVSVSNIKIV